MPRVAITGGGGFIGHHLVRYHLAAGADVTVIDDLSRTGPDAEFEALSNDARFIEHDLRAPLLEAPIGGPFDEVYHLAAIVGVERCMREPGRVLDTNIRATFNIVDWCRRTEPGALFLASTSEVSDGWAALQGGAHRSTESDPFILEDAGAPRASYALSKIVSEAIVRDLQHKTRVRIGRYFNVYGPRMGLSHVIPEFIERIVDGVDPFPIYGADNVRSFCFVTDAVEATTRVCRLGDAEPLVVNIGRNVEPVSMLDLAAMLFDIADVSPTVEAHSAPGGSPQRREPDLTTLHDRIGYRAPTGLRRGLEATHDWYRVALAQSRRR